MRNKIKRTAHASTGLLKGSASRLSLGNGFSRAHNDTPNSHTSVLRMTSSRRPFILFVRHTDGEKHARTHKKRAHTHNPTQQSRNTNDVHAYDVRSRQTISQELMTKLSKSSPTRSHSTLVRRISSGTHRVCAQTLGKQRNTRPTGQRTAQWETTCPTMRLLKHRRTVYAPTLDRATCVARTEPMVLQLGATETGVRSTNATTTGQPTQHTDCQLIRVVVQRTGNAHRIACKPQTHSSKQR